MIVRKDCIKPVGGEILGSCNHVAGLSFCVEAAVLLGHFFQICLSQLPQWHILSHKK